MGLIVLTGQTGFMNAIHDMVENFFDANYVLVTHSRWENVEYWLEQCDGVILPGGVDVHPSTYNSDVLYGKNLTKFDVTRDKRELKIIDYCFANGTPLLGICRGHQMLAVHQNIPLIQDLRDGSIAHAPNADMDMPPDAPAHKITFPSLGHDAYVNSYHHQGFRRNQIQNQSNSKILVDAVSTDGIVEAMHISGEVAMSVQWHPEADYKTNLASHDILDKFKRWL